MILAIDPGPVESAFVRWDGVQIWSKGIADNDAVLEEVAGSLAIVIEQVASYGMPVGEKVFETVFWSGRFAQAVKDQVFYRLPRLTVKLHLCHDSRAKDSNIRQALIDRFGEPGTKKKPGILYGVKKDIWSALALAVTWWDKYGAGPPPRKEKTLRELSGEGSGQLHQIQE